MNGADLQKGKDDYAKSIPEQCPGPLNAGSVPGGDLIIFHNTSYLFLQPTGLFVSVVDKLDFPEVERQLFGAVLTLIIAAGFASSVQIRCIVLLVVPTFCGRYGRGLIASYAIYLLITGE